MSIYKLERNVVREAKKVFNNPKLTIKHIMEWSTGEIQKHGGEVIAILPVLKINVAIKTEHDKRGVVMGDPVIQNWVMDLTYMQQSVLLTSLRGPDTLDKNHVSKLLIRWLRRCVLLTAFEKREMTTPGEPGGGSFTGPSISRETVFWEDRMFLLLEDYLTHVDETPHHFHLHLIHAFEIVGYKHPTDKIRVWFRQAYLKLVNDMHMKPESEQEMDRRLGDNEAQWRQAEEVTAENP